MLQTAEKIDYNYSTLQLACLLLLRLESLGTIHIDATVISFDFPHLIQLSIADGRSIGMRVVIVYSRFKIEV